MARRKGVRRAVLRRGVSCAACAAYCVMYDDGKAGQQVPDRVIQSWEGTGERELITAMGGSGRHNPSSVKRPDTGTVQGRVAWVQCR